MVNTGEVLELVALNSIGSRDQCEASQDDEQHKKERKKKVKKKKEPVQITHKLRFDPHVAKIVRNFN